MDWQQMASLSIVAVTAVLLIMHQWRRRQRAKLRACGSDCGCATSQPLNVRLTSRNAPESIASK